MTPRERLDANRRTMRQGMAKVALDWKRRGPQLDAHGQPLSYSKRMAEGHNERTLEKWRRGTRKTMVSV